MNEAKQTFEKFSKPDEEVGEEGAEKILKMGKDDPITGVLAFLHKDEDEAIEGYKKALPLFGADSESQRILIAIIEDEERHKRYLQNILAKYAINGGKSAIEATGHAVKEALREGAEEAGESEAEPRRD